MRSSTIARIRKLEAAITESSAESNPYLKPLWLNLVEWAYQVIDAGGYDRALELATSGEHVFSVKPGWSLSALFYQARGIAAMCDPLTMTVLVDVIGYWIENGAGRPEIETMQAMNTFIEFRLSLATEQEQVL